MKEPTGASAAVSNGGESVSSTVDSPAKRVEVKPLSELSVSLESIKPGESYVQITN